MRKIKASILIFAFILFAQPAYGAIETELLGPCIPNGQVLRTVGVRVTGIQEAADSYLHIIFRAHDGSSLGSAELWNIGPGEVFGRLNQPVRSEDIASVQLASGTDKLAELCCLQLSVVIEANGAPSLLAIWQGTPEWKTIETADEAGPHPPPPPPPPPPPIMELPPTAEPDSLCGSRSLIKNFDKYASGKVTRSIRTTITPNSELAETICLDAIERLGCGLVCENSRAEEFAIGVPLHTSLIEWSSDDVRRYNAMMDGNHQLTPALYGVEYVFSCSIPPRNLTTNQTKKAIRFSVSTVLFYRSRVGSYAPYRATYDVGLVCAPLFKALQRAADEN